MAIPSRLLLLAASSFLCAAPVAAKSTTPVQQDIIVDSSGAIAGSINGQAMRFQLSPNGSKVPVLNPATAVKVGLKPGWLNVAAVIGSVRLKGHTGVIRYTAPGTALKRRIGWFERPAAPGFDGLLGPAAVSPGVVTFRLREAMAGERVYRLPLVDDGYGGMGSAMTVGKDRLLLRWALDRNETTANAKAGDVLQTANGGQWTGAMIDLPVAFGVERPHRHLTLNDAFSVGPMRIARLAVRSNGTDTGSTDPDEIVVTANKKKQKGPGAIIFGRDALAHCSSLTFNKVQRQILLVCR